MLPHARPGMSRLRLALTIAGIFVLLIIVLFGVQVWGLYQAIVRGNGDILSRLQFTGKFTAQSNASQDATSAATVLKNVTTTDDPMVGNLQAPLTVVEFADFGCPFSREESSIIREIAVRFPNVVRVQYRDFPLDDIHPQARLAAEAGECAAAQGKFWAYHDKLYANQEQQTGADLKRYAAEVGLDTKQFATCLDGGTYRDEVEGDYQDGLAAGVRGTPTFFINGVKVEGAIPTAAWEKLVSYIEKK